MSTEFSTIYGTYHATLEPAISTAFIAAVSATLEPTIGAAFQSTHNASQSTTILSTDYPTIYGAYHATLEPTVTTAFIAPLTTTLKST